VTATTFRHMLTILAADRAASHRMRLRLRIQELERSGTSTYLPATEQHSPRTRRSTNVL